MGSVDLSSNLLQKKLYKNYNTDNISKVLCSFSTCSFSLVFQFTPGHKKVHFNFHGPILKEKSWDINIIHLSKNTEKNVAT